MNRTEYTFRSTGNQDKPEAADWHWIDYAAVLFDRIWIAIIVLIVVVSVSVYRTRLQTPLYRSSARIMIEENMPKVLNVDDLMTAGARNIQYFNTHVLALNSRTMVEAAMIRKGLDRNPGFVSTNGSLSARVEAALGYVRIEPVPQSRLIDIIVEHPDPVLAADFANGLADQYIDVNLKRRMETSMESFGWLKQLAEEYREKIEKGQTAIHDYRKEAKAVSLEENENIVVGKLKSISAELTAADSQWGIIQADWNKVSAAIKEGQPLGLQASITQDEGVKSAQAALQRQQEEVAVLKTRYQGKHPALVTALNSEREKAVIFDAACREAARRLEERHKLAGERVADLRKALGAQELEAMDLDRKLVKYNELKREVEADQQLYNSIVARMKETKITSDIKASNIRLVDAALPATVPFRPVWGKAIMTAVMLGLVLGIGLSFASYFLDDRLKRVEDVEHALGLPVLAVVPPVSLPKAAARARVTEKDPHAPSSEAFRSLRAGLALRSEWKSCRRVMITSTTAGEGKSMVASNLSIVLAHDGQKTVLIDGDMRRPTAHRMFDVKGVSGLSDVLDGKCALEQVICSTSIPNLFVIPAGAVPDAPSELLASSHMTQLLEKLDKQFDRIVVDCPPVFGVSDPISLMPAMQGVLFVVHYGKTGRRAAVRALGKVREGNTPFVGLVFNNVLLKLSSGYYYYYQYHKYGNEAGRKSVDC